MALEGWTSSKFGPAFCGRPATRKTVTVGYLACSGCRALFSREGKRAVGSFGKGSRRKRRPALSLSLSFWVRGWGEGSSRFLFRSGRPSVGEGLKSPVGLVDGCRPRAFFVFVFAAFLFLDWTRPAQPRMPLAWAEQDARPL